MNPLETLQILIEADYHGLEAGLRQGLTKITQFMDVANGQSINWVSILQGSFTPALIATIAGTFALSIEQALNFQNAVQDASLNTTTAFGNTTAAMTSGAFAISDATTQSAVDVEKALGQVSTVYKNYNDAQTVAGDVAQYASAEHISMADALNTVLPLLQQWNISATDAGTVLATLGQSTAYGKLSIEQLSSALSEAGPALRNLTTLPQAIAQLQEASTVPGFTPDAVLNMFKVLVSGANGTAPQVNAIFGKMTGDIGNDFDKITGKIKEMGPSFQLVAGQFGISSATVSEALSGPAKAFKDVDALASGVIKSLQPLSAWWESNKTTVDELKESWNKFSNALQLFAIPDSIKVLGAFFDTMTGALDELNHIMKSEDPVGTFLNDFAGTASNAKNVGVVPLNVPAMIESLFSGAFGKSGGGSTGSANSTPVSSFNTTYQINNMNIGSNGPTLPKLGSLLPGVPASSLPKSQ